MSANAHTKTMKKLRRLYEYARGRYELISQKKYTTIAGTLVFFLIMSIVPLTFWLTLLLGKLPLDTQSLLRLSVFDSVKEIFDYIRTEAQNATTGVSLLLLITTLYSATTLFYQMRKSGELIYGFSSVRRGWRLRLSAVVLMFLVMAIVAVCVVGFAACMWLFSRFFPPVWERIADYALLITLAFSLVLLLNAYICPYKMPLSHFLSGTLFTVLAWSVAIVGFGIYLRISNMDKLYGALSAIIVFMLWLYILMICFVIGLIINSEKIAAERIKGNG